MKNITDLKSDTRKVLTQLQIHKMNLSLPCLNTEKPLWDFLNQQRLTGFNCDLMVQYGDHRFALHQNIILGMSDCTEFPTQIQPIAEVYPSHFEILFSLTYRQTVVICRNDLKSVILLSKLLKLTEITNLLTPQPNLSITTRHKCHDCNKYFATQSYLQTHQRLHQNEKSFQCHLCGRKFSQRPGFTYHMRSVHTDEKRYGCKICGKTFIQLGTVKRHVETHPESKIAIGSSCIESFIKKLDCTSDADLLKHNNQQLRILKQNDNNFIDANVLEPGQIPNQFIDQESDVACPGKCCGHAEATKVTHATASREASTEFTGSNQSDFGVVINITSEESEDIEINVEDTDDEPVYVNTKRRHSDASTSLVEFNTSGDSDFLAIVEFGL